MQAHTIPHVPAIHLQVAQQQHHQHHQQEEEDQELEDEGELVPPGVDFKYASKAKKKSARGKGKDSAKGNKDTAKKSQYAHMHHESASAAAILALHQSAGGHPGQNIYRTNDMTAATTHRISSTTKKLRPGSQKLGKNDGKYEVRPRFALDRLPPWQCFCRAGHTRGAVLVLPFHARRLRHVQATAAEPVPC